ncbi:MAG: site-specific integrase [Cyanobium sp.]
MEELQARHYARRTVDTYEQWEMGSEEVNAFLTHLALELNVSASTQNQALSALLFLYRELLERDLDLEGVVRARQKRRLPVVLSEAEVIALREWATPIARGFRDAVGGVATKGSRSGV